MHGGYRLAENRRFFQAVTNLLRPVFVDQFTDYRYYAENQLPIVGRITALKDMGFRLAEISSLLALYDDKDALDAHLAAQQKTLEALAEDTAQRLRLIETARRRLRKDEPMNYNVTLRTLPERYCATVRMTIPRYQDEGMVWDVLCCETAAMALVPDDPCYCAVEFLDNEFKETNVEIMASKSFKGGYEQINDVVAAVSAWIDANGYDYAGAMFDIYHVSPHETKNPNEFVTEVCFPIRKK